MIRRLRERKAQSGFSRPCPLGPEPSLRPAAKASLTGPTYPAQAASMITHARRWLEAQVVVSLLVTGFVTPHSDDESLKGAIDRLWSEPGLAQRLGDAAADRAQTRHSLRAAARNFAQLTQKLLQVGS